MSWRSHLDKECHEIGSRESLEGHERTHLCRADTIEVFATGCQRSSKSERNQLSLALTHRGHVTLNQTRTGGPAIDGALLPPDLPSYVARLRWWADNDPHREAAYYSSDGERDDAVLTLGQMDRRARAIAAVLAGGRRAQGRALVVCPPGLQFHTALFGATYAGMTVVPSALPRAGQSIEALRMAARVTEPSILLTTTEAEGALRQLAAGVPELVALRWVSVDRISDDDASRWHGEDPDPDSPGYIILTSGSTATPKGVVRSHRAMVAGIGVWPRQSPYQSERGVSQSQPHTFSGLLHLHKMIHYGDPITFVSIFQMVERPVRWLRALSRTHASWAPVNNLLLDLCVRNVDDDERAGLDLSYLTGLRSSGEELQASALERFLHVYASHGLRRGALSSCYASTEAAMVTLSPFGKGPVIQAFDRAALENDRVVVTAPDALARITLSQSYPLPSQHVVIADPETRSRCAPDELGEIWVAGPGVADGYWNDPEGTTAAFGVTLTDGGEESFFRTGDLGFLYKDELYITGRLKDIIIVRGRNLSPGDIEGRVRAAHPALTAQLGAAVGVLLEDGEQLVVVQEVAPDQPLPAIAAVVRAAIAAEFAVQPHAIVFIPAGELPRTGSGKIQRGETRRRFERSDLNVLYASTLADRELATPYCPPRTEIERTVTGIWEDLLGIAPIGVDDPFGAVNGDSLKAMQVLGRLRAAGLTVTMAEMRTSGTIADLARVVRPVADDARTFEDRSNEPIPLTPAQAQLFWRGGFDGVRGFIITRRFLARERLDDATLRQALGAVVQHHEALSMTYSQGPEGISQMPNHYTDTPILTAATIDLAPEAELAEVERLVDATRSWIDMTRGPLIQVVLVHGHAHDRLVLCVHHLAVDAYSLDLFVRDLEAAYRAIEATAPVTLPRETTSLRTFGHALDAYLASPDSQQEITYVQELEGRTFGALPTHTSIITRLRAPGPRSVPGRITRRLADAVARRMPRRDVSPQYTLETEHTRALLRGCVTRNVTLVDVLLYALLRVMHQSSGDRDWLVAMTGHGRTPLAPGMDLSRTVGFFAGVFPMGITIDPNEPVGEAIASIQHQREAVPTRGSAIGLALQLAPCQHAALLDRPLLYVNFQGALETTRQSDLLAEDPDALESQAELPNELGRLLALFARVTDGRLMFQLRYHPSTFRPGTVHRLSEQLRTVVEELAEDLT
jgi:acyl-CoA synthetase (AMP-forming)/AMP-acid ligase II